MSVRGGRCIETSGFKENFEMKQITFGLLLLFVLISCASPQETVISVLTSTIEATQGVIPIISPIETPFPTLPPIPVATLNAVSTLDAIRIDLINQMPELEKYGTFCQLSYCYGVELSPNGQQIIITNGNTIDLFKLDGERIGKYSFYEFYGHLIGFGDGYASGVHWSKDGRYLYIATHFGDGGPESYFGYKSSLARVNLENGTWKDTGISGVISFSLNEKYIVYSTTKSEIRIRDLQSGEEDAYFVTDYYLYFGNFVWSPDSKEIIFTATHEQWYENGSKFALYMIDIESKSIDKLHESSFPFYYPVNWAEVSRVILNRFQQIGEWTLDLSVNPPVITP